MTQALIFNKNLHSFDVYSHPNSKYAKQKNCKYKYNIEIKKFTLEDFHDYKKNVEEDNTYEKEIILFLKQLFAISKKGYIWRIYSHDEDTHLVYEDEFYLNFWKARYHALEYCIRV